MVISGRDECSCLFQSYKYANLLLRFKKRLKSVEEIHLSTKWPKHLSMNIFFIRNSNLILKYT